MDITQTFYPAHAEGYLSEATGAYTHAAGWASIASKMGQTVIGEFNLEDTGDRVRSGFSHGDYAFIIGNGTHSGGRSNAMTVDWDGVVDCAGGFKVSGNKLFKIATCSKDNISISKSSTASGDITPTAYTGYTPIGVIGYNLNSASSSGANLTNCVPLEIYFSSGTVSYQIKNNNSSSAAKIKVVARVLYVRSELI